MESQYERYNDAPISRQHRSLWVGFIVAAAFLALTTLGASAASAAQYRTELAPGYVSAGAEGSFTFGLGYSFNCSGAKWSAELPKGESEVLTTSEASFSGCAIGALTVTAEMNGCSFRYGMPTGAGSPFTINKVDLVCPEGKAMVMNLKAGTCSWSIPPQTLGTSSPITNNSVSPRTATIGMTHSFQYTGSGGTCGNGPNVGTMAGKFRVSGYKDAARTKAIGFFVG